MVSKKSRTAVRENKHRRMRHHLVGTAEIRSQSLSTREIWQMPRMPAAS